jgi:hypothetical protein
MNAHCGLASMTGQDYRIVTFLVFGLPTLRWANVSSSIFLKSAYNSGNPSLPWKCQFFYPTAYAQVKSQLILNFRADFRSFWAAVKNFANPSQT